MAPSPPALRAEAIRRACMSGKLHAQIAREVGITGESLRRWLKQTDLDEGKRPDGLMSDEQEEERRQRWRRRREQVDDPNTGRRLTLFSPPHRNTRVRSQVSMVHAVSHRQSPSSVGVGSGEAVG